jgi:predicted RecB family nuclease
MRAAKKNMEKRNEKIPEFWEKLPWLDFLPVVKEQPFVVKGAFGFGLKAIAKNMFKHGLIETSWGDGPTDGLGAMVGAWYCDKQVEGTDKSMRSISYMKEIEEYNKVDCKVMWEIINYLRNNHT